MIFIPVLTMLETLKTLILDSQEDSQGTGVPRHLDLRVVPGKASVCIGVRRCGKSTYMRQIIGKLLKRGVQRTSLVHLNFFDDRLHGLGRDNLGLVTEAYYSLYPEKKGAEMVHFFFDEIQAVTGWESFVDRLMRTEKCEVFLTGSSAGMLSKEIATQMRGRALSWEMFPFSFREFLESRGVDGHGHLSTKQRLMVQKAFGDYWESGGFPEVVGVDRDLRIRTHQEYLQAILFRDLIERHDLPHPRVVRDLAHRLLDNAGSTYTVNKLTGFLKSLGHKTPKSTVTDLLAWFEDAYFLFSVRLFDASFARSQTNPKKIYGIDHSLVRSVSSGVLLNSGHLFENLVFTALRRIHPEIFYYKSSSGKEVDFIVSGRARAKLLIQACESWVDPRTKKREVDALAESMAELKLRSGTIVTRGDSETIKVPSGVIHVVPAWKFLLELQ